MYTSVIIATSYSRTDWLINRSLYSVYRQEIGNKESIEILIVDDNESPTEFENIKQQVIRLRQKLSIPETHYKTSILRNERSRFMSGTGAWNTGIFQAYKNYPEGFISILDDDDEYLPNHLNDCIKSIHKSTVAVFQRLFWKNDDDTILDMPLTYDSLLPEKFFIGNSGVQGSNMFFKTKYLIDILGFDENFPNTTDRDLMIRFLWHIDKLKEANENDRLEIEVLESIGVVHHNHNLKKVNSNIELKQKGLDLFYQKYRHHFSSEAYIKSISRANALFHYTPIEER